MPLVCGVDSSTQATKVVVVDADSGEVIASGRAPHEVSSGGGRSETDPAVWWTALREALGATGRAAEIDAISVAAQQHGLVVSGADGRPLRPAILWNDTRAAPDAEALVDAFGARWWADEVGSVPVASLTVSSWMWLRRVDPVQGVGSVRLPHDWLTERLCGRGVTDRGDASGTGWWAEGYVDRVLEHAGVDREWLPEVLGPTEAAGEVVTEELGLRTGIPVGPGTGDNMGAAVGLGLEPGTPVMSLGTSGTIYTVSTERPADASGVVAGFADATGRYLPLACTLNCTVAVDRVAAWLGRDREDVEDGGEVVVVPFFAGERTPNVPDATGVVSGLTDATTPGQVLRAAYEGAVVSLLDALERLPASPDAPLVLVGGGARGRVWRETVARLSGRALIVPRVEEAVAMGAAAQAAAVLSGDAPEEVARRWGTQAGETMDAVEVDTETLERHHAVRAAVGLM